MTKLIRTILLFAALVWTMSASARPTADESDPDADIREGAVEVAGASTADEQSSDAAFDVELPSFVKRGYNRINFNGADWSGVRRALFDCEADPFTVVHIGDSHIQADFATGLTRRLLQYDYGDAGRGLITPLKISGTNQPNDYTFLSHELWRPQKLMKQPWKMPMGFTGASISPAKSSSRITVGTKVTAEDYNPFVSLIVFHNGRLKINKITNDEGEDVKFTTFPSHDYTQINFDREQTQVQLHITGAADFALYGVSLSGNRPGVFYHTIGNNGATYSVYNNVGNIGRGISPLQPDLVIISLGTNEAFGKVNAAALYDNIDAMVDEIRQTNPGAQILLVTPMECQKSVYRTRTKQVKVAAKKDSKGKKRRSRTVNKQVKERTGTYTVNTSVATVRDIINRYGADHNIAVYDWYDVAGGSGASSKWVNAGLFSKDHVHHSLKGYNVQGRMLYEALKNALESPLEAPMPDLITPSTD